MTMKSEMGDDVYNDPGMSTSGGGTQRGVMMQIMIEKKPNKSPRLTNLLGYRHCPDYD